MFLVAFLASMVSWGNGVLKMQSQMRLMLTRMSFLKTIPT
jgi:hypothetical protein